MSDLLKMAAEMGRERGAAAASWTFDGNTTTDTYRTFLRMLEDGDPAIDTFGPVTGWLSGEYAEGPTPLELGHELGIDEDDEYALDEACDVYEEAAESAYWSNLERVARLMTQD